MTPQIIPGYPPHRDRHSSFYEGYHRNGDLPVFLLIRTSSKEQYSRPTPSGILYLALKPSISADESTSFSSLPIPLTLGDVKKVYLGKKVGKGNERKMSTYRSENPKFLEVMKNSSGIFKGMSVEF